MTHLANPRKARPPPVCPLASWTPWPVENQHLAGSICFSGGWLVHQVPVFGRKDGSISVGTPNTTDLDRGGRVRLGAGGKRRYRPIITFGGTAGRARWDRAIVSALAAAGITAPAGKGAA